MNTPSSDTGPGFLAFVAFFLLAVALWFLMRNMNARMRRMSYRQQAAHRGKDDPQADGSTVDEADPTGDAAQADAPDGGAPDGDAPQAGTPDGDAPRA